MIETVLNYFAGAIILILSLILYVFFTACLLPKLLLIPKFRSADTGDRGIKKYLYEDGRAIVYEPTAQVRKHIPQYILSDNAGERFLKCKLDQRIRSIRYVVIAFDASGKVLDILNVSDPVENTGMAKAVPLPLSTAYVTLSVNEVNGVRMKSDRFLQLSVIKLAGFVLAALSFTVAEALLLKNTFLFFADFIMSYSKKVVIDNTYTIATALLIGLVYAAIVVCTYYSKHVKIAK